MNPTSFIAEIEATLNRGVDDVLDKFESAAKATKNGVATPKERDLIQDPDTVLALVTSVRQYKKASRENNAKLNQIADIIVK